MRLLLLRARAKSLKRIRAFEEADEYCPGCDNHYVIPAKTKNVNSGPRPIMVVEGGREEINDVRTKESARFQASLMSNVAV